MTEGATDRTEHEGGGREGIKGEKWSGRRSRREHVDRGGRGEEQGRVQEKGPGRDSSPGPTGLTLSSYLLKLDYRGPWTVSYGQLKSQKTCFSKS